jgi:hypothetical protein
MGTADGILLLASPLSFLNVLFSTAKIFYVTSSSPKPSSSPFYSKSVSL